MKENNMRYIPTPKLKNLVWGYIICVICFLNLGFGPVTAGKIKEGNKLYEKENYDEALKKYTDAQIDRPESAEIFFNIGDILYKQRKFAESEQMFTKAVPQSDQQLEAKIYYNIGNCKYRQGNLRESLDYYKKALELNPDDEDAKYNIEFVEKKIKEMLSQSKERMEKQKKQEGKKEEEKKGEEKTQKETQTKEEEKAGQETQTVKEKTAGETEKQEEVGAPAETPTNVGELSKEEAEALLRMTADEEKSSGKLEDKERKRKYYPEVEKPW